MASKITSCCVALFFMLAIVAAVPRRFNSIYDLPNDARMLLYWFAQNVNINLNGIRLNFDPIGSYGSHDYGNYEGLLDNLPWGYKYLTIGNINAGSFPVYVLNANKGNRVRIIIRVRRDDNRRADEVYITRHTRNHHDPGYDSSQTYKVTADMLRGLAAQLQNNEPRFVLQSSSFSNQSYHASAQRSSSEDSSVPWLCVLFIILVIFLMIIIMIGNATHKQY